MSERGRLAQVALCTADPPASVRRYVEAFGFAPAGGRVIGPPAPQVARIQGLHDTAFALWWLAGARELFQLELFAHTLPLQRPRPAADLGWTGFAIAVEDLDASLARLRAIHGACRARGRAPLRVPRPVRGRRHRRARGGPALPAGAPPRVRDEGPAIVSVRLAVADLNVARRFYLGALELEEQPLEATRPPGSEALAPGAAPADGVLAAAGDRVVEVVRPAGEPRPLPADHRLSDQGVMNAAIGFRSRAVVRAALERVVAAGFVPNAPLSASGATYVGDGQGTTVELLGVEPERDAAMGFIPAGTLA